MAAVESDLIDLSGATIDALRRYDGAALSTVLDRLLGQLDAPGHNIAGYNGSDSPEPGDTRARAGRQGPP
ncbi:hypothetical protein ACFYNO_03415 [Kitasatospora sp. NPDC006697]|uniref:hypothetical protein n=1 Tax=Kitasatospora sp. NPDC006697 TaxID=3364020 RepID=UPI0036C53607